MSTILEDTWQLLEKESGYSGKSVESIYLGNFFNCVRLNDSSVGACMTYHSFPTSYDARQKQAELTSTISSDPLLENYLISAPESEKNLSENLKCVIISALSAPYLRDASRYRIESSLNPKIFESINSATVIGYGGFMGSLIRHPDIREIHISDLMYTSRKPVMDEKIMQYRANYPEKNITISAGQDNREIISRSDLVSITGSALTNGTMDSLLESAADCKEVIIQGQSASILPDVLFSRGATRIVTTIKPTELIDIALTDNNQFHYLLEGHLPWVYIAPKDRQK